MPRRPGDPRYPSDSFDGGLRFIGGAVFGLLLSALLFIIVPLELWYVVLGGGLVVGAGCGFLSAWLGAKFWATVRDLIRSVR